VHAADIMVDVEFATPEQADALWGALALLKSLKSLTCAIHKASKWKYEKNERWDVPNSLHHISKLTQIR